jgi:acetyl-CoA acyltransferase
VSFPRKVYLLGGGHSTFIGKGRPEFIGKGHPEFGQRSNPGLEAHLRSALDAAAADTGLPWEAVERVWLSNFLGEVFLQQGHLSSLLVAVEPGLAGAPVGRVEAACASGGLSLMSCIDALQHSADIALAVGVEIETSLPPKQGVEAMAYAAHMKTQRHHDFALFPWIFARRARGWREAHGGGPEDTAAVVVKAHENARKNPLALRHHNSVDLEVALGGPGNPTFLHDPELHPYIRLLDCTDFTDGASAAVLATEEGLRRLGRRPEECTELVSYGCSVQALGAETDPRQMTNMARAAARAYAAAGLGPGDVQIAEVHDCFAIAELQMMEALGFSPPGQSGAMVRAGHTRPEGELPINTGGGLLGFGHPIGATGVKQAVELNRQMMGRAGAYQVPGRPRVGLQANLGGDDRTGVVLIQRAAG